MKIRAVYQPTHDNPARKEVVSAMANDTNVITTTGQEIIVGEIAEVVDMLSGKGVDFSFLWKNDLIPRLEPINGQINIDACPLDSNYTRKVFVSNYNVKQNQKGFWFNLIVRHFLENVHSFDPYDDIFVTTWVDNTTQIDGIPEYNYFIDLLRNDNLLGIEEIQAIRIPVMQQNGRFGLEIYA